MEENQKIKVTVVPFVWLYSIVVMAIMWIASGDFSLWPFCFILGTAVSLFNFSILVRYVNRTKPEDLKKGMFLNYLIRYVMYAIVLAVVYLAKDASLEAMISTCIGFLSLKVVLFVYNMINRGEKI